MDETIQIFSENVETLRAEVDSIRKIYQQTQNDDLQENKFQLSLRKTNLSLKSQLNCIKNYKRHIDFDVTDIKKKNLYPLLKLIWNLTFQEDNTYVVACSRLPNYIVSLAAEIDLEPAIGIIANISSTYEGTHKLIQEKEILESILNSTNYQDLALICRKNLIIRK